jgi:hypothetical protein
MAYNPYGGKFTSSLTLERTPVLVTDDTDCCFSAPPYGRPPGYGGFPGTSLPPLGMGAPPGIGAPPGMAAPGTAAPPGIQAAAQPNPRAGLPSGFQPPANMPSFDFSAPVIRLGTGPGAAKPATPVGGARDSRADTAGGRAGLGMERGVEQQRQALRDTMLALVPPTKEEIVRTLFIAGITEGAGGDEGIERILNSAGRLRRWDRATDADGKPQTFGFAQFEDPESLDSAIELLKDIEVPVKKQQPKEGDNNEGENGATEIEKKKLLVFVDDNSLNYLEKYHSSRGDEDPSTAQARLDSKRAALRAALHELFHPSRRATAEEMGVDVKMADADGENVEVVNIPLAADDELADIPAEMRETVAQEIAAFRDRSIRRDMERLKREEEMEAAERQRNGVRPSRLASPPPTANNIPVGPRDRSGVANAPSGPKSGPRDYQKGVNFVNGSGTNGNNAQGDVWINRADEDSDASDEELERRRIAKRDAELEKQYLDQERRWLNRERSRTAALHREKERDDEDTAALQAAKKKMAARLEKWDDDSEASRKVEEYYADRSMWLRKRAAFRAREAASDERDRADEERETERDVVDKERARGMADNFLDRQAEELQARPSSAQQSRFGAAAGAGGGQQPFKLSLGAAAQQKAQKATTSRRTVAEVEGLLEDEEDNAATSRRTLIPIKFDPATQSADLTEEERDQAIKDLAASIPSDRDGLWGWDVKWDFVDEAMIGDKLRPFIERKVVEYLGLQEDFLVEVVVEHVRKRGRPAELVEELEGVSFAFPLM